jgi:hypothetical protein
MVFTVFPLAGSVMKRVKETNLPAAANWDRRMEW